MADKTTDGTTSQSAKLQKPQQAAGYSHLTGETTSQSTRLSKDYSQVAGYNPASAKLLDGHPKDAGQVIGYELSVIIITKNEAANIRDCIESVAWADEIIVVDSGSTDDTVAICREFTPHVYTHDWPGFGAQKNRALGYASKNWVLSLDADERVTPELHAQLIKVMEDVSEDGFYLPRLSQFCGRFIRHSGWYPDYVLRLFKRTKGRFSNDLVHESVMLQGSARKLSSPLLHYSYMNEADVNRKVEQYASAAALQMFNSGKAVIGADAPVRAGWAFFRTYCLRLGFLDGIAGFNIARMNARTTYLKYRKLKVLRST